MSTYEALAIAIATFSVIVFDFQVRLAGRTLMMNHERRKNQATIDFMLQIRPL